MDPSITKFLQENEDETMISDADVEANSVALNKDGQICGQADNAVSRRALMQVPFGLLLPDIQSQLDTERGIQLQNLHNRMKSNRLDKREFIQHMKTLVGDHMINLAIYKLRQREQLSAKQNTQKSSPYVATSSIHRSLDSNTLPTEDTSLKTRLLEQQSDSHGVQHTDFPQSSFSTYGNPSSNYHISSSPSTSMSSLSLQMSQGPVHPIRMHGSGSTHFTSNLPNLSNWQPSMHKDQTFMSSMAYRGPDHMHQTNEQQKSQVLASQGPSSFSQGQHKQASRDPGFSKDNTSEMLSSRPNFSKPMDRLEPRSITAQLKLQNASAGNLSSAAGSNAKTPPKKSTVAQKKPLEVQHVSSPSKRQKVSGAFSDQSIEHFSDVTALSGVNLREEEGHLFSGFKEENQVSEATRKLVQEEEERSLFLQKVPLQKKVAEIMAKCGVKNKSNDVERCMSRCVEERMHGLITNLIKLSKQRVNIEKPRRRTVITSDIGQQIMSLNKKALEELKEKQADADKLQRADEVNKEEYDKLTTAANVAARAAVGVEDMLSKWQLKAEQASQKRKSSLYAACASRPSLDVGLGPKRVPTSISTKENPDTEWTSGRVTATCGPLRKPPGNQELDKSGNTIPLGRTISVKDVISVLGREIQMSRSTLMHHLHEKSKFSVH